MNEYESDDFMHLVMVPFLFLQCDDMMFRLSGLINPCLIWLCLECISFYVHFCSCKPCSARFQFRS